MLPITHNHEEEGLSRLPSVWDSSPKVKGLLLSYLREIQEVEDTLFDLLEDRSISTAVGVQLDVLGDLLNEPRGGRTDEEYREYLKALPLVYRSGGTANELLQILKQFSAANDVRLWEHGPGNIHFYTDGHIDDALMDVMTQARSAGVRYAIIQDTEQNSLILTNESTINFKVLQQLDDWDEDGLIFREEERVIVDEYGDVISTSTEQPITGIMLGSGVDTRFITSDLGDGLCTDLEADKNYIIEAGDFSEGLMIVLRDATTDIAEYSPVNGLTRLTTVGLTAPKLCIVTTTLGGKFIGSMYIKEVITEEDPSLTGRSYLPSLFSPSGGALATPVTESGVEGRYDPYTLMTFNRDVPADEYDKDGNLVEFPIDTPRMAYDSSTLGWRGLFLEGNATEVNQDRASVTDFTIWHTETGSWVIRVASSSDMEELLLFDGAVILHDVSGDGVVVVNQTSWTTADVYVDGVFSYEITEFHDVDFQALTAVQIANQIAGSGYIKEFYFSQEMLTEEQIGEL